MPVNSHHPDYDKMAPKWKRMRDTSDGQDAIHAGGAKYLPMLPGETEAAHRARIARTPFFEATWRTIEGLRGMLMRKEPDIVISAASAPLLADVTKSGIDLNAFTLTVAEEALTVGRVGVMVDYPSVQPRQDGRMRTTAEALAENLRPHLAMYTTESIINWRVEWRGNRAMLVRVVLEESAEIPNPKDRFSFVCEIRWRVLELNEAGIYVQSVYRHGANKADELLPGYPITPTVNGAPLRVIPFKFIGTDDTTPSIDTPPLLGLANLNISHYQTTADIELGAHRTALPTPYVTGNITQQTDRSGNPVPMVLHMGGESAWLLPGQNVTVGMLEFNGTGLGSLEKRLEVKERQMAILGARMLEQQKAGVEAAETAGIHRAGENSTLATIGATISKGMEQALVWFDQWAGGDGVVEFKMNDEFFPANLTAQDVLALLAQWQAGGMSAQEHFDKLQKGGWIRDGKEFEDHETEIANNPPPMAAAPLPADGSDDQSQE